MTPTSITTALPLRDADGIRRDILAQHQMLRRLLSASIGAAARVLRGDRVNTLEVPVLIQLLRQTLLEHMAFEERYLVPALFAANPWGPTRAQRFLDEHRRQRAELASLDDGALVGESARTDALLLQSLASDILVDMAEEERDFLGDEALDEGVVVPNQSCG